MHGDFESRETLRDRDISSLLHPFTNAVAHAQTGPDVIVRGEGVRVFDQNGQAYLDGMSGLWGISLGYSEARLIEVADRQLRQLPYFHSFSHKSHPSAILLADKLLSMLPVPMSKVFFTNSGSESVESAIKLAWYYWNGLNRSTKKKIIARQRAYHGVNVVSGSATGLPFAHNGFGMPLDVIARAPCPHYWRYGKPGESEQEFSDRMAAEIEALILSVGPDNIAAFIAEPVMGAGGVIVPPDGYFPAVQRVLDRYEILMIADEVICGFGRTGRMFGSETFNIRPDIMTFAKQLSSSYLPIGAVTISQKVFETVAAASNVHGVFGHGYTYSGHPVSAAVALETLNIYEEREIVSQVQRIGPYFQSRLRELEKHALVGEVRGVGLIAAIELVADKASRKVFEPLGKVGAFVERRAYENGLITRTLPSSDSLALCPPLICTKAELDEIVDKLKIALDQSLDFAAAL